MQGADKLVRAYNSILHTPEHTLHYLNFCRGLLDLACAGDDGLPAPEFDAASLGYIKRLARQACETKHALQRWAGRELHLDEDADMGRALALLVEHDHHFNKMQLVNGPADLAHLWRLLHTLADFKDYRLEHTPEGLRRQGDFLAFLGGLMRITDDTRGIKLE